MKTCFKCLQSKPVEDYYRHPMMADGRIGKCKECTKKDSAAAMARNSLNPEWVAKEMDRHRLKSQRYRGQNRDKPVPPEKRAAYLKKNRAKYPEKASVRRKVAWAVSTGKIIPQPCFCGKKAQAHHPDYSKPLDVVWLCPEHHGEEHARIRREQLLS